MTRTALKMNGLAEFRIRSTRQGAKAPFKTKEQNRLLIYQLKYLTIVKIYYNITKKRSKDHEKLLRIHRRGGKS